MSTSIITLGKKAIDVNDRILLLSLFFIRETANREYLVVWFSNYISAVIDKLLFVKPVGWADLELDDYLLTEERMEYFLLLIDKTISDLGRKKIIKSEQLNEILNLKKKEELHLDDLSVEKLVSFLLKLKTCLIEK